MTLPFTRDAFLDVFAAYNLALWPAALVLWLMTAAAFTLLVRRTSSRTPIISWMLAIQWAWAGLVYHAAFFSTINPAAWAFGVLFVVEAALLAWRRDRLHFSKARSRRSGIGAAFVVYALVYPLIAWADGNPFPRLPTFGVPCPTTIATIGFLLAADRSLPTAIALIPLVWAVIGGSAAFFLGMRADLMLLVAGLVLTIDMVRGPSDRETLPYDALRTN